MAAGEDFISFATRTTNTRDDWQTPSYIVDALGKFDLDPCANIVNPARLATQGYIQDGLTRDWYGRVWMNPPYGRICREWMWKLAVHGNGIALIPPRVGSQWFHHKVLTMCNAILFLKGRIAFLDAELQPVKGNNADSILIAFGKHNVDALNNSGLPGALWSSHTN